MELWNKDTASKYVFEFNKYTNEFKEKIIDKLNSSFSLKVYYENRKRQLNAIKNSEKTKKMLLNVKQKYPPVLDFSQISKDMSNLSDCAFILTAGGEGERFRESLIRKGFINKDYNNFTKATFPVPNFPKNYGTLQINLLLIKYFCEKSRLNIPVIVTTGPALSKNSQIIKKVIEENDYFKLDNLKLLEQNQRLHLTCDGKIVFKIENNNVYPVTNPDETGGPFIKLKEKMSFQDKSYLEWLKSLRCKKVIALQATAIYDPQIILAMASVSENYDCIGVGVLRTNFKQNDPFGSFVSIVKRKKEKIFIVEQDIRNNITMELKDSSNKFYLPYNTGFYVFDIDFLLKKDLPDYATPPKEILPNIPKSPKIGYAATDYMPLAEKGAVLAIPHDSYSVIKNAEDLYNIWQIAKKYKILNLFT